MKTKLDIQEIKNISLDILISIDNFCSESNITYFLACGTLLGCIKYKGFIPWDDDIDLMMPRPDYEKFINSYKSNKYKVLKPETGMYFYAKVYDEDTVVYEKGIDYKKYKAIGVSVDIFPLDGIPNNEKIIYQRRKRNNFLETLLRLSNQPIFYHKNKIKAVNRLVARLIGSKNIVKTIERNCKKDAYSKSDYVVRFKDTPNGFSGAIKKELFVPILAEFENRKFYILKGYDQWLRNFYGDEYLTKDPPIEKRRTHNIEAYRLF